VEAPAYVDPTGTTMGFGGIAPTEAFKGILLHGWLWRTDTNTVPDFNEVATKTNWIEEPVPP